MVFTDYDTNPDVAVFDLPTACTGSTKVRVRVLVRSAGVHSHVGLLCAERLQWSSSQPQASAVLDAAWAVSP